MSTFNKIINKVINLDNNIFLSNYDKTDKIEGIHKLLFYSLYNNIFFKNKFHFLNENLNNFYFINNLKYKELNYNALAL